MPYGISEVLIRGEFMRNKGYTLVEVIFSLALIGLIAVTFLPMITFGVKNTFKATDFTDVLFAYQREVEDEIDSLRDDPDGLTPFYRTIFGNTVTGHNIHIDDDSSSEIYMFLPKKTASEPIPVIKLPPIIDIRKNDVKITISPQVIDLLDDTISLFVKEIDITPETDEFYLMSVYRWYMSSEMDISQTPSNNPNEYFIIKEWNEAKKQLSYEDSSNLKFIPNIKNLYNSMVFSGVKGSLSLIDEDFINTFGNRYIRYGVTPFSLRGRIGKEEMSNAVYVQAPRIVLLNAVFTDENKIVLTFNEDISAVVDSSNIVLNESIGPPISAYRDESNHKRMIMEFGSLDTSVSIAGNKLLRGAVQSEVYGKISVWHNNTLEGDFTIYDVLPIPVESVTINESTLNIDIGDSYQLIATVSPYNATNKNINCTSDNPEIVSVDSTGLITGITGGTTRIMAKSAADPTIYDEVLITVRTEEEKIIQELINALEDKVNLTVNNATGSGTTTILAPSDSNGIVYTFTAKNPTNTARISISGDKKSATVSRPTSGTASVTITLRATKNSYYQEVVFNVSIPRNTSNAVTATR